MAECNVCIGGDARDFDGAPEFQEVSRPKARKPHKCTECHGAIAKGDTYQAVSGKFDGEFYYSKTCLPCAEIRDIFACDNGVNIGDLWSEMRDHAFPQLTTGSECFRKLSAPAKEFCLDRWRKWKGLPAVHFPEVRA